MRFALLASSAVAFIALASSQASADIVRTYPLFTTGIELNYGAVIYDPEDGTDPINLTGLPVTSTHIKIGYAPAAGEDVNLLNVEMVVPTDGANQYLLVLGSELTQDTPGHYVYDLTTSDYNGTIRGGRFSVSTYSLDADQNPISTQGIWDDGSGISLIVQTPEPAMLTALAGALTLLTRRRR